MCFETGRNPGLEGTIIQNAIRMFAPHKDRAAIAEPAEAGYAIGNVLRLEDFERFVFVMSVLEQYTDHDCSVLLGCSRRDIAETRMRALLHLAESSRQSSPDQAGFDAEDDEQAATRDKADGATDLSTRTRAKATVL